MYDGAADGAADGESTAGGGEGAGMNFGTSGTVAALGRWVDAVVGGSAEAILA